MTSSKGWSTVVSGSKRSTTIGRKGVTLGFCPSWKATYSTIRLVGRGSGNGRSFGDIQDLDVHDTAWTGQCHWFCRFHSSAALVLTRWLSRSSPVCLTTIIEGTMTLGGLAISVKRRASQHISTRLDCTTFKGSSARSHGCSGRTGTQSAFSSVFFLMLLGSVKGYSCLDVLIAEFQEELCYGWLDSFIGVQGIVEASDLFVRSKVDCVLCLHVFERYVKRYDRIGVYRSG